MPWFCGICFGEADFRCRMTTNGGLPRWKLGTPPCRAETIAALKARAENPNNVFRQALPCGHTFCSTCVRRFSRSKQKERCSSCPSCRSPYASTSAEDALSKGWLWCPIRLFGYEVSAASAGYATATTAGSGSHVPRRLLAGRRARYARGDAGRIAGYKGCEPGKPVRFSQGAS